MAAITINDLLEAGVHFGHQTKRWNPKMKPYIYGARNGISIFDLTVTIRQLAAACDYLRDLTAEGGTILFVGSKRQAQEVLREAAERVGMPYMCDRWLGGTLTNFPVIRRRVEHLKELQQTVTEGSGEKLTKKELAGMRRELDKLQRTLGGIANMPELPDALLVVDVIHEAIAVKEANRLGIPVVAIVDSNGDPDGVNQIVPGNDDALRSIKILVDAFASGVAEGRMSGKVEEDVPAASAAAPAAPAVAAAAPVAE